MSPSVLLSAQGGKWDPSIALRVQNWALLPSERSNWTPSLNPMCPVFSPRAAEEEKGCSELKSKCFHLRLTMPSEMAASWRAVFQQRSLSVWKLQLEQLLCLLGVTAVGMSVASSSVSQLGLPSFWQQPGSLNILSGGCLSVGETWKRQYYSTQCCHLYGLSAGTRCQDLYMDFLVIYRCDAPGLHRIPCSEKREVTIWKQWYNRTVGCCI